MIVIKNAEIYQRFARIINGHFSIKIRFINNYNKTIKYVTFYVVPIDFVGEPINCSPFYGSSQTAKLKYTGPLSQNDTGYGIWENVVHNDSLGGILIKKYEVIFMDESKETFRPFEFIERKKGWF